MTSYSPCKPMFGSLAVMGFIWLLLVNGSYQRGEPATTGAVTAAESGVAFKEMEVLGGNGDNDNNNGKVVHPEWHLNYMSKRRVPNGPDPIHNRRAGNSGRPPGKA